jgi:alpha-D-xyloside xylohydrolase
MQLRASSVVLALLVMPWAARAQERLGALRSVQPHANGFVMESVSGQRLYVRPYGPAMLRLQWVRAGEAPYPDDHYEAIVARPEGRLTLRREPGRVLLETPGPAGIRLEVARNPMRLAFYDRAGRLLLRERDGVGWSPERIGLDFVADTAEHFLGWGQKTFGYMDRLDLRGTRIRRNYAEEGIERGVQGNLLVPFFISSRGYGLFLNSTFPNEASFGDRGEFALALDTHGFAARMDVVFLYGPTPVALLDRYTRLTGRPRLPPRWAFGLQLSDNDPPLPGHEPIDELWWKTMVTRHRAAGFPLDHMVFDNDWRAGGGGRVGSRFEFDLAKYPDPPEFRRWYAAQGLTLTLDLNLNNVRESWGWKPSYNIPTVSGCSDPFANAYPDYSRRDVRRWLWQMFWKEALDPALKYPGDGIWLDESDEIKPACVPDSTIVGSGRSWAETRNAYYFLNAKAVVQEGWDAGIGEARRSYVWLRGGSAGGQRLAIHWTGDTYFDQRAYVGQIVSAQASGLAGYPYFNHDAGGFSDSERPGPRDSVYINWGIAFASFAPIWRPHGYGLPRWPLNRDSAVQAAMIRYGHLRYELMPYIYAAAHVAHDTGLPMARALALVYPDAPDAWAHPRQYLWGDAMLVAPSPAIDGRDTVAEIWLPPASRWYYFWNDSVFAGGRVIRHPARFGELPVWVRAGAIIPRRPFALSTAWLSERTLTLDVYAGADGAFTLPEDDGVSERYRTRGELRRTRISYHDGARGRLVIAAATGSYAGAWAARSCTIRLHGLAAAPATVTLNGRRLSIATAPPPATKGAAGASWSAADRLLTVTTPAQPVGRSITIDLTRSAN